MYCISLSLVIEAGVHESSTEVNLGSLSLFLCSFTMVLENNPPLAQLFYYKMVIIVLKKVLQINSKSSAYVIYNCYL